MEPKFQTSFIPKKPVVGSVSSTLPRLAPQPKSIFMTLGVLFFVLSLLSAAGAYGWKLYLVKAQKDFQVDLANREKQFNIVEIEQLKKINYQIDTANRLLKSHLSASQVFDIISKFTIEKVRFLSLELDNKSEGSIHISLSGEGTNLFALAFQSQVLGNLDQYNLRGYLKNPIMSDPTKQLDGTYSFNFQAEIDRAILSYMNSINSTADEIPSGEEGEGGEEETP